MTSDSYVKTVNKMFKINERLLKYKFDLEMWKKERKCVLKLRNNNIKDKINYFK